MSGGFYRFRDTGESWVVMVSVYRLEHACTLSSVIWVVGCSYTRPGDLYSRSRGYMLPCRGLIRNRVTTGRGLLSRWVSLIA